MGAALVTPNDDLAAAAEAVAQDVALFDQRGCLSPRIVGVAASMDGAAFAERLAGALAAWEVKVPSGAPLAADLGERVWYREVSAYVGRVYAAGSGYVGYFEHADQVPLPPAQRCVSVFSTTDLARCLAHVAPSLTVVASGDAALRRHLVELYPGARITQLGSMQCPPFDGPVDKRTL
jgi:Acyl-CoA reductase (LuxC)